MMPYEFDYFFNVMFMLVFAIVAVTFIVILVRGISEWNSNNHSPKLGVEATCVSKRTSVTHHNEPVAGDISGAHGYTHSSSTTYYASFEVESGDRMEFPYIRTAIRQVKRRRYGDSVISGNKILIVQSARMSKRGCQFRDRAQQRRRSRG
jgi:hypothetical protein